MASSRRHRAGQKPTAQELKVLFQGPPAGSGGMNLTTIAAPPANTIVVPTFAVANGSALTVSGGSNVDDEEEDGKDKDERQFERPTEGLLLRSSKYGLTEKEESAVDDSMPSPEDASDDALAAQTYITQHQGARNNLPAQQPADAAAAGYTSRTLNDDPPVENAPPPTSGDQGEAPDMESPATDPLADISLENLVENVRTDPHHIAT